MSFENILNDIDKCNRCPLLEPWRKFSGNVHGNFSAKTMLVSEAPGERAINNGRYWTGASGKKIRNILTIATNNQIKLEDIFYMTDIVKCCPPENRTPKDNEIANCYHFLSQELHILKPNLVLALGGKVLSYFSGNFHELAHLKNVGITKIHNNDGYQKYKIDTMTFIPLLHPSSANRSMNYEIYRQHLLEIFQSILNT